MARTNAEQWAKRVERWKDSGLTAKQFAAETGLKASTLSYWRWRLSTAERASAGTDGAQKAERVKQGRRARTEPRPSSRVPACVELPVAAIATSPAMLELMFGDVRVRVPSGFDEATLTRVVRALGVAR